MYVCLYIVKLFRYLESEELIFIRLGYFSAMRVLVSCFGMVKEKLTENLLTQYLESKEIIKRRCSGVEGTSVAQ